MYATDENLKNDFEDQITTIIRQIGKASSGSDDINPEKLRQNFEELYFGSKIFADEYFPESNPDIGLNDTFFNQKKGTYY